ncbi:FAD/NAD(P)-binding protein [Saccharomonospora sp. NPDC046836]|uniref:FAD/NAD(P)-binding protein n=1 Tax=Saccharomonospora sp. NPDC046836 TaxID=3156921 RepID=UPI0033FBD2EA
MPPFHVAIVGAGPRGIGALERLSANGPELVKDLRMVVHLIDPYPPGPGRIWRYEQSPLLRMNSMPADVTMFTDDTVRIDGPVRPGPSLSEWAELVRTGAMSAQVPADVEAELTALTGSSFPTRRLQSAYLTWVYEHVLADLPATIEVREHRARAVAITGETTQRVWLEGHEQPVPADAVLLSVGHLDTGPDEKAAEIIAFATRHSLSYFPPGYTADVDYSAVPAGEPVLVSGFGLAFVDLMLVLTEGRGGRFEDSQDGGVRYVPSGSEPVLYVGSRRGVPYHAKPGYQLPGPPPPLPRFFDDGIVDRLLALPGQLDFHADIWPHAAKEIAWGYYSELFTSHPTRVRMDLPDFAAGFAKARWGSADLHELVRTAVPAPQDRLDLDRLDRPLAGLRFDTADTFAKHLRGYVEADLSRRADPEFSADLGAFTALLSVYGQLARLAGSGRIAGRSQVSDVDGWWHGFFSYFASGPPPGRLRELLALHDAGLVGFLGADIHVELDDERGTFSASGSSFPGSVEARTLIEARLPVPDLRTAHDPLVRSLLDSGAIVEEILPDTTSGHGLPSGRIHTRAADGRLLDASNRPHPRRFALGHHTSTRSAGAFTRPRTNALSLRQNDAVARHILTLAEQEKTR